MKFNHYTINSHHNYIQDTNEILKDKDYREYLSALLKEVKDNPEKPIYLLDDIYIRGIVEENLYALTIEDKDRFPLLETAGAKDEEGESRLRKEMGNFYQSIFNKKCYIEKNSVPIVYDIPLPWIIKRIDIVEWTGDFCRSFGAIAFEEMTKEKCN